MNDFLAVFKAAEIDIPHGQQQGHFIGLFVNIAVCQSLKAGGCDILKQRSVDMDAEVVLGAGEGDIELTPFLVTGALEVVQHEEDIVKFLSLDLVDGGNKDCRSVGPGEIFQRRLPEKKFEIGLVYDFPLPRTGSVIRTGRFKIIHDVKAHSKHGAAGKPV